MTGTLTLFRARANTAIAVLMVGLVGMAAAARAQQSPPDADTMFQQLDTNGDGRLSMDDAKEGNRRFLQQIFSMTGKSPTDSISRDEFRKLVERHRRGEAKPAPEAQSATQPTAKPDSPSARQDPARPAAKSRARTGATRPQATGLTGVWRGWVVSGRGEDPNSGQMELELRIEANRITARELGTNRAGGGLGAGTFQTSSSATPSTIDALATSGRNAGQRFLGIFALDGDTLRWCSADKNRPRPQTFATGQGNYLMILRRSKP